VFCEIALNHEERHMNPSNWLVRTISVAFFFVVFAATASAQYRAGIQGTITDPSGAVVSGAKVTVTAKDTGLSQQATTDTSGVYSVNRLAPGLYTIVVRKTASKKRSWATSISSRSR
jgi:uncharacterized surface anchored protein